MLKRVILLISLTGAADLVSAQTELVANGSFETGTFAGWTTNISGTPFLPWLVSPVGAGAGFGMLPTQPQDGLFVAWNGFDGLGPMNFTLYQDLKVPLCLSSAATITWKDRVQWNFALTNSATKARTYVAQIRDTSGAVLATPFSFSTGTARVIGDSGWQSHTANLNAFAGSTVRLWFQEDIPEPFTGPAQLEIDAVSAQASDYVSIDNCCTTVPNRIDARTGATLQQLVAALVDLCTVDARNHGDFVSCVTRGLNEMKGGIIRGQEKGAITSCAARSSRGHKYN